MIYQRILLATDGSPLSDHAAEHAMALARMAHAELIIATVVPPYPRSYFDGSLPLSSEELDRIQQAWKDEGDKILSAIKTQADTQQIKSRTVLIQSDMIADALIAAAKENHADLIVMASHGRKGVSRLLLGSETQDVLTHSHLPVLVLR